MSLEQLEQIKKEAQSSFAESQTTAALYEQKVRFLGKNGLLTEAMKKMASLSKEEKPLFGKAVNEVKSFLEEIYNNRESILKKAEIEQRLLSEELDLTLPAWPREIGHPHPIQKVTQEIFQILARLGYSLRTGPLIEKDRYNFEALNIPADHPARDMQDTFFVDATHVLRTHTSPIQIQSLEGEKPPLRIIGTGGVFRCDSDISHLPHFQYGGRSEKGLSR